MKRIILPFLLIAVAALAQVNVQKTSGTNAITGNLVIGDGKALTASGSGTISATGVSASTIIAGANGGTGVANTGKVVTLGGNFTTSGAFGLTLTLGAATNVTLPATGTLATLAGSETLTNKTLTSPTINGGALSGTFSGNPTFSGNMTVSDTTNAKYSRFVNTSGNLYVGVEGSVAGATFTGSSAYESVIDSSLQPLYLRSATIRTSGNFAVTGNLTVSGTGTHSFGGLLQITAANTEGLKFGPSGPRLRNQTGLSRVEFVSSDALDFYDLAAKGGAFSGNLTVSGTGNHSFAGPLTFKGTQTNDNAATGYVGEYVSSTVTSGSAVTLTNATTANVTSISLTAGDWDVSGVVYFTGGEVTGTRAYAGISSTSASIPATGDFALNTVMPTGAADVSQTAPTVRKSLSSTTTIYLVTEVSFTVGTPKAYGTIRARRVR